MTIKPFKFIVQAVLIEEDDEGQIVREIPADPVPVYGYAGLAAYLEEAPGQVERLNQERAGSKA